jgi:uncharacterized membrane protein
MAEKHIAIHISIGAVLFTILAVGVLVLVAATVYMLVSRIVGSVL